MARKDYDHRRRVRCYMDGIDWQHHLGYDPKGKMLYPDKSSLEEMAEHDLDVCGIVEVEVRLIRWAVPQNMKFHTAKQ